MSENIINTFTNNEFGEVRTTTHNEKFYFCASDVAKALGYLDTAKAVKSHCKSDGWVNCPVIDKLGRTQQAKFITEGNVYRLIARSKLESAERFEKWVFDEVLPTIRKTGGYVSNDDLFINTYLPFADEPTKLLFRTTLTTINQLNAKIERDKPLVEFAEHVSVSEDCITMNEMAKLAQKNGIKIGRNKLFALLRKKKVLQQNNVPYQRYIGQQPWFQVKESVYDTPHTTHINLVTMVTAKGQEGILRMLRKDL